ncbi:MAG: M28 family peptidase, partial [Phycisphaerales bacterium]|nr:M28 family peptidase [Phycisphaerales bacterium]
NRTLTKDNRLSIRGDELVQGGGFIPFSFSSSGVFQGKIVFCGFGIVNLERKHDDFAPVDLKGNVALLFDGEPRGWADPQGNPSPYAFRRDKVYNAKDHGAVAVLFVSPRPDPDQKDELAPFEGDNADEYGMPAMHIKRDIARKVFETAGAGNIDELQKLIDEGGITSALFKNVEVSGEVRFEKVSAPTRNVLGVRRGEGPLADEFVVIGAHYDHLGVRRPMMRRFKEGKLVVESSDPQIHNGADDNASGVSGLIEIAKMFASPPRPKRSVLFVAFTAEETGLQGSKYYAEHPFAPLDRTTVMLNMDMVGRLGRDADRVTVFGAGSAKEFGEVLESAGKIGGLKIAPGVDSGGRSDHAVFVRRGVPSMHFFSGNHADYHKPGDDAGLINSEGGAHIATIVYETAKALANLDGRPTPQAEKPEEKTADPHAALGDRDPDKVPSFKVVMGLSPNYADDGKPGMGVDAVSPDGPADRAGMKAGDRIIRISGKSIANIYDYMASTRNNNPGDTIEVVVLRDGQEQILKVTLSAAR